MGLCDPEHPFWGYSITHQLLVAMIDLHNKFEASSSPSFQRQDVTPKFINVFCYPGSDYASLEVICHLQLWTCREQYWIFKLSNF